MKTCEVCRVDRLAQCGCGGIYIFEGRFYYIFEEFVCGISSGCRHQRALLDVVIKSGALVKLLEHKHSC